MVKVIKSDKKEPISPKKYVYYSVNMITNKIIFRLNTVSKNKGVDFL
jgi:hypothetical protein